jgi:general nucleoside transport system permease protein
MKEKALKVLGFIWSQLKILFKKMQPSLIAVGIGISIGFVIMLIFNPAGAFSGLGRIIMGGFAQGTKGFGDVLFHATPIILTGLALVVAFRTGLFNIGASGQMIVGGYVAAHIGVLWTLPSPLHWIVAILFGTLAGALWGMVPGILKAVSNTNEVVVTIMMNYIGTLFVIYLVKSNILNPLVAKSRNIMPTAALPRFGTLFGSSAVHIGILIAIVTAILIHILIHKTTLGYQLQSSGFNKEGSRYAGMNAKQNIITAMTISGALAGLAGTMVYLVIGSNLDTAVYLLPAGFDGISVALLGLGEPIGALFAGIFLSHIRQGGFYMQIDGFVPQIIDIIISVIVYVTAISAGLQLYFKKLAVDRKKRIEESHTPKEEDL